ncbi:MAG: nucleoside recognition domain-containing protein [Bacillota bacterium]|nr:nucleoside recognition domain-containing protein [Bacillota bacterium]
MLNKIWFALIAAGVCYAACNGDINAASAAAFAAADNAVTLMLSICGMICLWMGIMRIAEAAGLNRRLARALTPLLAPLFPSLPRGHAVLSTIAMNVSANLLGLGNAATPFGVKAMQQLRELNNGKRTASAPMVTLLALNTSSLTLLPSLVISLRSAAGSMQAQSIIAATIIASGSGMCFALLLDALLRRVRG